MLALVLVAQSRAQQLSLKEFGHADGLRNLAVTALAQDATGFIWAGTENGAYQFDGARFERIGAEQKLVSVNSFAAEEQRVWIAADGGLWLWRDERLQRIQPDGPRWRSATIRRWSPRMARVAPGSSATGNCSI